MRKLLAFLLFSAFVGAATDARAYNPFMGDYENQVAVYLGQGVNNGFLIPPPFQLVPFYMLQFQYSQPTTFFRMPARQSINFGETIGVGKKYGWDWRAYTIPMIFLTEDIALLYGHKWYLSVGAGGGLQAQQNERIGSKWLFQAKLALAYRFTESVATEIYVQHFSNGNTAEENNSYGFYGMGFVYNF